MAALVALSHFGVQAGGFNPGQWAVISFYTLSGLLMERQFHKLSRKGNGTPAFYLDRLLRIYPLYLVVLSLAWAGSRLSWGGVLANVTLLPLNYSYFTGVPVLIGPAWSLACEAHFYLLVPLLVLCSTRTLRVLLCASLLFFATSPFMAHSAFWAYTGLPGILFAFLTGILISRKDRALIKILWLVMLIFLIAFGVTKCFHAGLPTGININVAIGYLIAALAVPFLDGFSPNLKWDRLLGLFSYPLFLCHGIVADFFYNHWQALNPLALLLASIMFSAILILAVEIPFDRIRYRIRASM